MHERHENMKQYREAQVINPLLALAGTLECKTMVTDDTMSAEIRETSADKSQEAPGIDPLLALAGTLECEETDIGERHDDYMGDTLLAELREDDDE
jgi:hypothetical protein